MVFVKQRTGRLGCDGEVRLKPTYMGFIISHYKYSENILINQIIITQINKNVIGVLNHDDQMSQKKRMPTFPNGFMYGIFTYIWLKLMVNVGSHFGYMEHL